MATSGSYDWKLTRDQVITASLRKLGVLPSGGTPSTNQTSDGVVALNSILKAFHADGMPLWAIVSYNFTTVAGTNSYTIGTGLTLNTVAPLKVIQARYKVTGTGMSAISMNVYNRYDFNVLPNSTTVTGTPIDLYYQPLNSDQGTIKLWPYPVDSTTTIYIDYQRPFTDMDASGDDLDFPNYWTMAITYMLAWALAPEYGTPPTDREILQKEAEYWKDQALSYGTEEGSLYFSPDKNGMK